MFVRRDSPGTSQWHITCPWKNKCFSCIIYFKSVCFHCLFVIELCLLFCHGNKNPMIIEAIHQRCKRVSRNCLQTFQTHFSVTTLSPYFANWWHMQAVCKPGTVSAHMIGLLHLGHTHNWKLTLTTLYTCIHTCSTCGLDAVDDYYEKIMFALLNVSLLCTCMYNFRKDMLVIHLVCASTPPPTPSPHIQK